ncbi:MAG: glycosyltransferase family 2 protein [Nocardiaceae bacterium]|nr:glycosyltransferase family 2 protein [Nocardiaceae bacterium]
MDRQTYRPAEVIISDNGSTDGLPDHIANHPLREKLSMKWVDSSQLKGSAYARNVGAKNATG